MEDTVTYNKYPSKKTLMIGYDLHLHTYRLLNNPPCDYKNLITEIGVIILRRDIYTKDTDGYFKNMIKNYFINDEYLLIVRALLKPYIRIIGNQNLVGTVISSPKSASSEQKKLRDKLDQYFIEMLYNQIPHSKASGLPVIFCDTYNETNNKMKHEIPSYYIL